jgi:hypothetical protein
VRAGSRHGGAGPFPPTPPRFSDDHPARRTVLDNAAGAHHSAPAAADRDPRPGATMIRTASTRLAAAILAGCALHAAAFSAPAAAQEPLRLSATARQGALATYSAPLDVREHGLWGAGRAGLDLRTLRIAGSVRNAGESPVRLVVFAAPDSSYAAIGKWGGERALSNPNARFLALFWIDIGPSTVVNLADHAPRDPAALQRMMGAGPVRFGLLATGDGARAVRIEALNAPAGRDGTRAGQRSIGRIDGLPPLAPFVRTRRGDVSLLDATSVKEGPWLPGAQVHPGDAFYPLERRFIGGSISGGGQE